MGIFDELQKVMQTLEVETNHEGCWYSVSDALIILVCGMLCRLQTIDYIHEWSKAKPLRRFFEAEFGMVKLPCRAQFYNILKCVDAEKFNRMFIKWMQGVLRGHVSGKTIAIDGKTVCGTGKLTEDGSVLHIASAILSEMTLVIGSIECVTKTGEITAFRELLDLLDVSGAVVVADALHCNQKSANAVIDAGADYLFVVKDNVPALKSDIELFIREEEVLSHTTVEKNGGRIEKRTAYATADIEWLSNRDHWKNLSCIGAIHREFEKSGQKSSEWHYYISSASLSPEELLNHARLEWGVEAMHWLLDVHFAEDKTAVWDMNVQKLLNVTRKIALNLARIFKAENCSSRTALSDLFKRNLFDTDQLSEFLHFFKSKS
jgi:predicted transposase YbfD/YdcC